MDKSTNELLTLREEIQKLYYRVGQFNLYMSLCHKECDAKRLKFEIEKIIRISVAIESEIDAL